MTHSIKHFPKGVMVYSRLHRRASFPWIRVLLLFISIAAIIAFVLKVAAATGHLYPAFEAGGKVFNDEPGLNKNSFEAVYAGSNKIEANKSASVQVALGLTPLAAVNGAPVAFDDSYTVMQGQPLVVSPPGVLINDKDPDYDHLLAHLYQHPSHGTLNFSWTGGFSYYPEPSFSGIDKFTYRADDGSALRSNEATVTITVTPMPSPTPTPTPTGLVVQFGSPTFAVTEGCVPASLNVLITSSPPLQNRAQNSITVTVDYAISHGTASQRSDYTYLAGTLTTPVTYGQSQPLAGQLVFAPGETTQSIQVLINQDSYAEGTEILHVYLSNPQGAVLGSPATATLAINDDDLVESDTNPIDDSQNFVCQQYHDFLHRQPDDIGLAFWTSQITQCGADAACIDWMRHNVAMAFFLSIEYQQSGYFVDRLYEACLTRRPNYEEFMQDLTRVAQGVEVGASGWELRLEQNKEQFSEQFVQRSEFTVRYPEGTTAAEYVDGMYTYAAVQPTATERQAAIDAYGPGDVTGRARAMRQVMESDSLYRAYYNRAFVLAEYFGYLRRDPNDWPDGDWNGYYFWLAKMTEFSLPGEDVTLEGDAYERVKRAEMVRALILSREYRERFGRP